MNPLVMQAVTKRYGSFELGPVDFELPRGFVTGLVGANGAGKTTLIKIALGLVHPSSGSVSTIDVDEVGVVFDVPALPVNWRVKQVAPALAPFHPRWDQARFDQLVSWAGITPKQRIHELSRGMGMKLQVSIAMARGASVLVLDEPTAGLDPLARSELLDMIAEFMTDENHTVLFSSHITTDLEKIADHLLVLSSGQIVAQGPMDEVVDGFRFVRGGRESLAPVSELLIAPRQHKVGWEALMRTEDTVALASLPGDVVVQAPTVEEIVVALAKEGRHE